MYDLFFLCDNCFVKQESLSMHKILTKWIEPYVLLENLKKHCEMKDFTFDGFSKETVKKEFLKYIEKENSFGLYMKNVNKFYAFKGQPDIDKLFGFEPEDYIVTGDLTEPFKMIDLGKAEASFIIF